MCRDKWNDQSSHQTILKFLEGWLARLVYRHMKKKDAMHALYAVDDVVKCGKILMNIAVHYEGLSQNGVMS